jgi:hypothetical protein
MHQIADRHGPAAGLQAQGGEAVDHRQAHGVPARDQPGEEADQQHLADQGGGDVLVLVQRPQQTRQAQADHRQRGEHGLDIALDQPKPAADLGRIAVEELVQGCWRGGRHGPVP